jgi:hypothetical protein
MKMNAAPRTFLSIAAILTVLAASIAFIGTGTKANSGGTAELRSAAAILPQGAHPGCRRHHGHALTARGVLRTALDPTTGALVGPSAYIATTAGLDGSQPTAAALGPDSNLYVGFLKSGNVKRNVSPWAGTTQVVQSVGNTPRLPMPRRASSRRSTPTARLKPLLQPLPG